MKLKKLFEKFTKQEQGKIEYELKADNGDYEISLFYKVDQNFFLNAWKAVQEKFAELKDKEIPARFEIPAKVHSLISGKINGVLGKVEKETRFETPNFKLVSHHVNAAFIEKKGDKFILTVEVSGICLGA